ncbi:heme-degrading domain-containing protein [Sphingomonas sp. HITSZ_GF]|uniref:heme-degrading domain-containing protein n=1 Tax=Sphingomonas sp. HITSZ_GF TaxID=3037247 RepID=UPI00240E69F8|nr:heme-degrading domain-containing protein [Sphingomonas sp. HITSZ_GF]MDG2533478.1 heme-degrading domain-containing protein [Sphingomonas sp. HITSZ_GF]
MELEAIDREEQSLALQRFDAEDAWWLGCHLRERGAAAGVPIAIEIRRAGTRLFSALLPGATADNLGWIDRKIALVMRFERSSYVTRLKFDAAPPGAFDRFGLDPRTHVAAGGAVPIRIAGTGVIGAVAISGLTQEEDHLYAVEALAALKAHQESRA